MLDQQINEQLGLLQKELSRLKTLTDYIDGAKENSTSIIVELEKIQKNYAVYTDKLFNLYQQYIGEVKKDTEHQINAGVAKFDSIGSKIDSTNNAQFIEIKRLLEQYKQIVEATNKLVITLEKVDFPFRLSAIENNVKEVSTVINNIGQLLEKNANAHQLIIINRLDNQDTQIKTLKILLFVICSLIVIGTVVVIIIK